MKKATLVLAVLFTTISVKAEQYKIDAAHSGVEFKIRHLLSKTSGRFKEFEGEFNFDEKKLDDAKGKMTIQVRSLDSNSAKRDEHLFSSDFFDVKKYETITFESKKFKKSSKDKYKLEGNMTMHGVTKPVTFDVEYLGTMAKDPFGMKRTNFVATGKINRNDFDMGWNKPMDSDGLAEKTKKFMSKNMLGDEVEISINIEATAETKK